MAEPGPPYDLVPGTLEMLVLRALCREPMHGYAIAQHLKRVGREKFRVEEGSLYPALQRLLAKGWVTANWKPSPTGRRARIYSVTAKGRERLTHEEIKFNELFGSIRRILRET
jgi:PadR family transcriptional regulator